MLEVAAARGDCYPFLQSFSPTGAFALAVAVPWVVTRGVVAVDPPVVAFPGLLRRLRVEAGLSRTPSDSHPAHRSTQRMTGSPGYS